MVMSVIEEKRINTVAIDTIKYCIQQITDRPDLPDEKMLLCATKKGRTEI